MKKRKNARHVPIVEQRTVRCHALCVSSIDLFFFVRMRLGAVLKCSLLKIAHDKYRTLKRQHNPLTDIQEMFHSARQGNAEISGLTNTYTEILNPVRVLELLERIPTEVCL
jgi:hypothetical protein